MMRNECSRSCATPYEHADRTDRHTIGKDEQYHYDTENSPEYRLEISLSVKPDTHQDAKPIFRLSVETVSSDRIAANVIAEMEAVALFDNRDIYDVVIVGGGPAGLACGVCGTSAGLKTIVIEREGQAEARVSRTSAQTRLTLSTDDPELKPNGTARKQGRLVFTTEATGLSSVNTLHRVETKCGHFVLTRTVVVASGAEYRRLDVPGYRRLENCGIHYAATGMEAALCVNEDIVVVGAGISACQAAVFLCGIARQVHVLVRGPALRADLSSYLAERLCRSPHIHVHASSEIVRLGGMTELEEVVWRNTATDVEHVRHVRHLFVMIGAVPNTRWLSGQIDLDRDGFVLTGTDPLRPDRFGTSRPGIFAVGDVRSGAAKREDAAVSEGVAVIAEVRRYLGTLDSRDA